MAQLTSGTILRDARERKGYELATVARRLRIRPDILEAIENGDFSNMPPRGYARNMVNAYARLLGLNPTEIVHMYLDEAYANQVQKARSSAPSRGTFEIGHEHRYSRSSSRSDNDKSSTGFMSRNKKTVQRGGMTRDLYDDRTEFARYDYGLDDGREMDPDDWRSPQRKAHRTSLRSESTSGGSGLGIGIGSNPFARSESRRSSRGTTVGGSNYTNFYAGPKAPGIIGSHLPLIIGLALVLLILVIVLVVFTNIRSAPTNDVADLPVTGISDTTGEEEEVVAQPQELAPTSVHVKYEVKPGCECYAEVYENDGEAQALMLVQRQSAEFEVTGKWTFTTWVPDNVIITVDGKRVNLISDENYDGMSYYTVDFNQILNQWNEEHNITPASNGQQQNQQQNAAPTATPA